MAQPRQQQQRRGGGLRLLAALLVLLPLCLAVAAAASAASPDSPELKEGVPAALQKAVGQEPARGSMATTAAERIEEEGPAAAVLERVEMEVVANDYGEVSANNRHNPHG